MKILNPIYDNAFKYLMDNEEIAKMVLSIILNTRVVSLQSKPQETPLVMLGNIHLSRFDFKAVIRTEQGENTTVLVEIQKYKTPNPISRFRLYLAQNLMKSETIATDKGEETKSLPIISIYILGFDLPEFDCNAIRIDNTPHDIIGQKTLSIKSEFVEQLTHKCFILIATDKPKAEKKGTRLEKFLKLFLQKLEGEASNPIIEIDDDIQADEELQTIIAHLNRATLNEELIRRVTAEKEYLKGIESLEIQIEEAKAREEEERKQKEEERRQKEEERKQKEEAKARLLLSAQQMKNFGIPIDAIQNATGLLKEEIENL